MPSEIYLDDLGLGWELGLEGRVTPSLEERVPRLGDGQRENSSITEGNINVCLFC